MDVDTTNCRDVWLVKVPKYLATAWKNAPQKSELGKLQVPKNGNGTIKLITDSKLQESNQDNKLPNEHVLTLQPLVHQRMVILSQTKDVNNSSSNSNNNITENKSTLSSANFKVAIDGDVKNRGELRPTGDTSYMNLKTSSIKLAAKPTRVTQILKEAVTSYKPRGAAQLAHEADLRKKKEEAKKLVREDKEVVQGRLFTAFEKQQYYNIKDLVRITNQSIPYLKEILKEICQYCSNGTHKNMWELKPEYRHYKSASGSQVGSK